ncbi:MAG: DUF5330 domain-containing protein [Hyphomicrobium sp.]
MSIIKTAAVLAVIVALLPSDKGRQQQLYQQAVAAANSAATYCDRNAETCARAADVWAQFKVKAEFAAGLAKDAIMRYAAGGNEPIEAAEADRPDTGGKIHRGTLSSRDMEPGWRGTSKRQGI